MFCHWQVCQEACYTHRYLMRQDPRRRTNKSATGEWPSSDRNQPSFPKMRAGNRKNTSPALVFFRSFQLSDFCAEHLVGVELPGTEWRQRKGSSQLHEATVGGAIKTRHTIEGQVCNRGIYAGIARDDRRGRPLQNHSFRCLIPSEPWPKPCEPSVLVSITVAEPYVLLTQSQRQHIASSCCSFALTRAIAKGLLTRAQFFARLAGFAQRLLNYQAEMASYRGQCACQMLTRADTRTSFCNIQYR